MLDYKMKGKSVMLKYFSEKHDYSFNDYLNNKDITIIAKKSIKFMF